MGSGTSLKIEETPPAVKLAPIDEEKVSNIVEVCNVSREEAFRVLDACHMDETMAIERFLSGTEVSTWSQVSKKKKPSPQTRSASGSRGGYNHQRNHDRDRDRERDRDRRDRDRSAHHSADHTAHSNGHRRNSRQQGYSQRGRESSSASAKRRAPQAENVVSSPPESVPIDDQSQSWGTPAQEEAWGDHPATNGATAEAWGEPHAATTDAWADPKVSAVPAESPENAWTDPTQTPPTATSSAWGMADSTSDNADKKPQVRAREQDSSPMSSSRVAESPSKQPVIGASAVKRTFNYAAAAAAGTSHEKPAPIPAEMSAQVTLNSANAAKPIEPEPVATDALEDVVSTESADVKKRRNRGARKPRGRVEAERHVIDATGEGPLPPTASPSAEPFDSQPPNASQSAADMRLETQPTPAPDAWGTNTTAVDRKDEKQLDDSSTAVAVASAAVIGGEQSAGDSLSLQFGSFGLGGLDSVNWSASEQKAPETVVNTIVSSETTAVPPAASMASPPSSTPTVATGKVVPSSTPVGIASTPVPASTSLDVPAVSATSQDVRIQPQSSSSIPLPSGSSGGSGSGMFPMLPVGPGGSFAPPNYGTPYLMPPLHGYSPAMASYENGAELGTSRAPSLGPPGSLPLYDPATLPGMASGNGKYAGIPGLGDMGSLQGVQAGGSKDAHHGNVPDVDKSTSVATSGLPTGMDPLAPPYVMPGYASMQYQMYTFPTGPYAAPPGMAPPGASPFPYPPAGQVSSQGGRGGFGFEDGPVGLNGNSRNGSGLGESMYTPGYLNSSVSHSTSQKGGNEGSYKQVRGNPGNSLGGMGMGGGMVHGMTYGDYQSGMPGVSNGAVTTGGGPGSWNNRQHSGGRADSGNGPGVVSNQSMGGASQNSSVYAAGPGAPGGYWAPQQGGYYP